jgi:uncharacterized iron-regulated membrane protein
VYRFSKDPASHPNRRQPGNSLQGRPSPQPANRTVASHDQRAIRNPGFLAPVPGAPRLDLDAMVAKAHEAAPQGTLSGITLNADPTMAAIINMGRELTILVDPYTGAVRPGVSALRSFFHVVTDWHRWLGTEGESREIGRAMTGACNAAFAVLVVSGFYLWWPRRWTRVAVKAVTVPSFTLRGKPRDWNWHNVAGFWSASVFLMITLTGVVISYQWANSLIYILTGSEPPPAQQPRLADAAGQMSTGRSGAARGPVGTRPDGYAGSQPRLEGTLAVERREGMREASRLGTPAARASLNAMLPVVIVRARMIGR